MVVVGRLYGGTKGRHGACHTFVLRYGFSCCRMCPRL
jgi:hypothetical protein